MIVSPVLFVVVKKNDKKKIKKDLTSPMLCGKIQPLGHLRHRHADSAEELGAAHIQNPGLSASFYSPLALSTSFILGCSKKSMML